MSIVKNFLSSMIDICDLFFFGGWEGEEGRFYFHTIFIKMTVRPNDIVSFQKFGTTIKSIVILQDSSAVPKKDFF